MNLVIDIGNSAAKTGCFSQGKLIASSTGADFTLQEADGLITRYGIQQCIVSSVRDHDGTLMEFLQNRLSCTVDLSHTTPLPFRNLYRTPEHLGKDRIAAAAGAYASFPDTDTLVIDMGTAITFDILTARGEYLGGNISPGMAMRFRALHSFTSRLPLVGMEEEAGDPGTDTRSAIISGVQKGIVYETNGYIERYAARYPGLKVILTGGDADFFAGKLKSPIFVVTNLVLNGLNFILDFNAHPKQ